MGYAPRSRPICALCDLDQPRLLGLREIRPGLLQWRPKIIEWATRYIGAGGSADVSASHYFTELLHVRRRAMNTAKSSESIRQWRPSFTPRIFPSMIQRRTVLTAKLSSAATSLILSNIVIPFSLISASAAWRTYRISSLLDELGPIPNQQRLHRASTFPSSHVP